MGTYLRVGFAVVLLVSLAFPSAAKETPPAFVEMEARGMNPDAIGSSVALVLVDKGEKKVLPIWIGIVEAGAIERGSPFLEMGELGN